jgi:outer membrane receptor protein involved in Fe transport
MSRHTPSLIAGLLLLLATLPVQAWQEAEPESEDKKKKSEWSERVVVTAEVEGAASAPRGASTTVLEPTRSADPPQALTDLVSMAPAVSENGQGGLFQNVSIRGVSRQRVRHMISGVRITDERRAGPASSFVDPLLLGSVEVLRGPATTFHGSGALGGTIQALPRKFEDWTVQTGWSSEGDGRFLMAGGGGEHWSLGFARREQDNSEAADGTVLNDHFEQTSAVLRFDWGSRDKRDYTLLFVPSRGEDIGKANTDFPTRVTTYPEERHDVLEFTVRDKNGWGLRTYVHDRDLETLVTEPLQFGEVVSDSTDYGVTWDRTSLAGEKTAIQWGFDVFGRTGVDSTETLTVTGPLNPSVTVSQPLDAGREEEWGGFAVLRWKGGGADWEGGVRLSGQNQGNTGDPSLERSAVNGFVGVIKPIGNKWEIRGAASSGERFPSLGELFFSGISGRGEVFGNPTLASERALNTEIGFAFKGSRLILRSAVFRNDIDDYIERIEFAPDMLTFVNLTSGKIDGVELSGVLRTGANWLISFGGHLLEGRASDGSPLADVPPHEIWSEARWRRGKFQGNVRLAHRATKDDPGSGENSIPSVELLSLSARYQATPKWAFYAGVRNAFDELYYRSADDKAPPATGRAFSAGLIWGF